MARSCTAAAATPCPITPCYSARRASVTQSIPATVTASGGTLDGERVWSGLRSRRSLMRIMAPQLLGEFAKRHQNHRVMMT